MTALSDPVALVQQPTLQLARRVPATIQTVLLATDLSGSAIAAALYAMDLASQLGARLLVMSVIDATALGGLFTQRVDQIRSERERGVQELVLRARAIGAAAEFLIWQGDPGPTIISAAQAERADLIVIGTRGREGVTRLLLGSVSDYVARHAACPVMVVHPVLSVG